MRYRQVKGHQIVGELMKDDRGKGESSRSEMLRIRKLDVRACKLSLFAELAAWLVVWRSSVRSRYCSTRAMRCPLHSAIAQLSACHQHQYSAVLFA